MIKTEKQSAGLIEPQTWVDLYGDQLFRYALARVRNRAVAEDLVQETFLAALAGYDRFEGRSSEKTWLVAILKHKILDYFRKLSGPPMIHFPDDEKDPDHFFHKNGKWKIKPEKWDATPERIFRQKEFWNVLTNCLSELPEQSRTAFNLREMDGHGCDEICKVLEISSSNCWVILYRARMALRRCLEVNWFGGKDVSLDV